MEDLDRPLVQELQASVPASPPDPSAAPKKSALLIVFLVVFIDLFGFGIVLPLLPRYANDFLPSGTSRWQTGVVLGTLMASFSAMQFVFAPVWGRISDRIGRRPVLLTGLAGSVLFYALLGYALSLPTAAAGLALALLFVARVGAGLPSPRASARSMDSSLAFAAS